MDFGGDDKIRYTYDSLGRVSARTVENGTDAGKLETAYSFAAGGYGEDSTTPLVESIQQPGVSFDYAYDNRGNIISEKRYAPGTAEADKLETTYEYDALGQLIRVNDPHENVTWVYTYDRGGNILRKARCAYTTGDLDEALEVIPYTYSDANWKDKLTAYNGKTITYDAIGNPLNDGERTYEWEAGRRLKHISIPLTGSEPAGLHISYGLHAGSQTLLKIIASNDNTVLTAQVARDDREITAMCPASSFNWMRVSGDAAADAVWNASHAGMKQITLLPADMASDVQIMCTYSETEGSYGTMQVDEALMASHTPATADANDVFALVDGDLVVTTASENGTDYVLEDDTLTVNSGFTGTISATAAFSSGEQDADAENIFGLHFENAAHADSQTLLRIVATNENTALEAHVVRGGREITAEYPASQFNWTRVSGDAAADAAWNASHAGMKQIALTPADTVSGVEFRCTYSETEGSYGTVQVDGAMTAYHTPAVEDANDAFALVDGVLTVTTDSENGSDYAVDGNTLIVNSGFTGTITSTVTVTDGARTREIDFFYDHNGLRTGKVVTEGEKTETTEYTLHGKLIMHMTRRSVDEYGAETVQNLHFFYDAQSRPAFVEYNGTKYRYLQNLQGDIVGIVDGNGNLVVEYRYDAWGKPISITGTLKTSLGELNPFRYRGYVWDNESRLYYLRDRYYVTEICRMLNADSHLGKVALGFSHSTYTYCLNNAVKRHDPDGCVAISAILSGLAYAISGFLLGVAEIVSSKNVSKRISTKSKIGTKERFTFAAIAAATLYSNALYNIKEKAADRAKAIEIAKQYRIDGAPYYAAQLTDYGIWVVGDPMAFEVAFSVASLGEDVWCADQSDMLALAEAVGKYTGYRVDGPQQGKKYSECWHYHLIRGEQKAPNHFFFGYENVEF